MEAKWKIYNLDVSSRSVSLYLVNRDKKYYYFVIAGIFLLKNVVGSLEVK